MSVLYPPGSHHPRFAAGPLHSFSPSSTVYNKLPPITDLVKSFLLIPRHLYSGHFLDLHQGDVKTSIYFYMGKKRDNGCNCGVHNVTISLAVWVSK
mgnify:CR=1 FL=1